MNGGLLGITVGVACVIAAAVTTHLVDPQKNRPWLYPVFILAYAVIGLGGLWLALR